MNEILFRIKKLCSSIKTSAWLSFSMFFFLIILIDSLTRMGIKWRPLPELSISTFISFWGFVISYRKEFDLAIFRIDGNSAVKLGVALIIVGFLSSILIVLPYILY